MRHSGEMHRGCRRPGHRGRGVKDGVEAKEEGVEEGEEEEG